MNNIHPASDVRLGLGLLSIGRAWGFRLGQPPAEDDALLLLRHAVSRGVSLFDTAPAYGTSERILGRFLQQHPGVRDRILVSTKMGEHWDDDAQQAFTDHSYDALCRSLDRSLRHLGHLDLLQIHKATADVLGSKDIERAITYARSLGVLAFGASVSDLAAAEAACAAGLFTSLQFPYNPLATTLQPIFERAAATGMTILTNRPFAMGQIIHEAPDDPALARERAITFVLRQPFKGYVLTGTRSPHHLDEAIAAFDAARASLPHR